MSGPDYAARLRDIDVQTLRKVGEMIRNPPPSHQAAPPKEAWKVELAQAADPRVLH